VFSSIDHLVRYAYGNQPNIAQWNLARLAETLLPLLAEDMERALAVAEDALSAFASIFRAAYLGGLRRKLGLAAEREGDTALAQDLLTLMAESHADFTQCFSVLCSAAAGTEGDAASRALFADGCPYDAWAARWRQRMASDNIHPDARSASMRAVNPAYIPRNHLVEAALDAAVTRRDFAPFEQLLEIVTRPFEEMSGCERYGAPPAPEERVQQTFCGT
jgi:serine/tyrosine/threonine adenylyltransferase